MSQPRPRVYACHPMTSYGSEHARCQVAGIASALAHCEIVDPEHCHWSSNAEWRGAWPGILATLAGLVVLADDAGTAGGLPPRDHRRRDAQGAGGGMGAWSRPRRSRRGGTGRGRVGKPTACRFPRLRGAPHSSHVPGLRRWMWPLISARWLVSYEVCLMGSWSR